MTEPVQNSPFAEEKRLQLERDRQAFDRLSPRERDIAEKIANAAFHSRRVLVIAARAVVGAFETVLNVVFLLPYKILARGIASAAEGIVGGIKLGARGIINLKKLVLKTDDAAANERIRSITEKIDGGWKKAKASLKVMAQKTGVFVERYVAVGLYRATKWLLDPRTPSGKPLLRWEPLNKAVGLAFAAAAFLYFSYQFSMLTVLGKVLHVQLAHSFVTDTSPLLIKLAKQAILHPAITLIGTVLDFTALPVIAAARRTLKSTPFTQGMAYQYNVRLNALLERDRQKALEKAAARAQKLEQRKAEAEAAGGTWRDRSRHWRQKSLAFVRVFIDQVVEKTSPEFYESRIKHYAARQDPPPAAFADRGALGVKFDAAQTKQDAPKEAPRRPAPSLIPPSPAL